MYTFCGGIFFEYATLLLQFESKEVLQEFALSFFFTILDTLTFWLNKIYYRCAPFVFA